MKNMKIYPTEFRKILAQIMLLIAISFLHQSCFSYIDDTDVVYTKDFTVLKGHIVTENGTKPIKGMKLTLDFYIRGEISGTYRKIRNFETDSNGYFNINFYPTSSEIQYHNGSYRLKYVGDYPEYNFVDPENILGIVFLNKRDTVIEKTYLMPTISYLKLVFPANNDTILSKVWYGWGDMNSMRFGKEINSYWVSYRLLSEKEYLYEAAGNQMNYIKIYRRYTNKLLSTDSVYVPVGDTTVYNVKL